MTPPMKLRRRYGRSRKAEFLRLAVYRVVSGARCDAETDAQYPSAVQAHAEMLMRESEAEDAGLERPIAESEVREVITRALKVGRIPNRGEEF